MKQLLLFILLSLQFHLMAQVRFTASAKGTVAVGEQFALVYEINAEGQGFHAPTFKDFEVLSGPNQSSSTSIQIMNGRTVQNNSYSFTYYLRASKEGKFTVQPASIKVNGKNVESNPIIINVVKGNAAAAQQGGGQGGQQAAQGISGDDIFVKAVVDKPNPYQGEQINVTYKLYFRINVNSVNVSKPASNAGFWTQVLESLSQQSKQSVEVVNGQRYNVVELQKTAMFAQKSGRLTIDPLEVECIVRVKAQKQRSNDVFSDPFFDSFFDSYANVKKSVKSNAVTLNVNSLPATGKPADFGGSVGSYTMTSSIDKSNVKANDAVNLKFTISGTGNIKLIEEPSITFPPDVEKYSNKSNDNVSTSGGIISGKKTFEYLLILRAAGVFKIPSYNFIYFDPSSKTYKTVSSPEYKLNVAKGDGNSSTNLVSSVNQEDVKLIGSDIRFIQSKPFALNVIGYCFFNSMLFYFLLLIPFIIFILFLIIWRKELKKRSDVMLMKHRKATKVALKRLKTAFSFLKENKQSQFYEEISRALFGYVSDKLVIPLADLSMDNIQQRLNEKSVKVEFIDQLLEILNNCEFARFSSSASAVTMDDTYKNAMEIIEMAEREIKS